MRISEVLQRVRSLVAPPAAGPVPDPRPSVLELRIHGISNTPPAGMLGLTADQVEQVDGDDLGSFWAATEAATETIEKLPSTDYRRVPPNVRREAYSWGAMARLASVPGLGAVSGIVAGVIRALWVVIIPFGFANVAFDVIPFDVGSFNQNGTEQAYYAQDTWSNERYGLQFTGGLRVEHS